MDLIDRYIAAIARELPEAQAADVAAELRDVLLSEVEAAEAERGRPLTADEQGALLVRFGHPLTVAGRYRKTQHLIGPEVFPFWWAGVKLALLTVAGVYAVLIGAEILGGGTVDRLADRIEPSLGAALIFAFGVVTLVCALIERFGKTAMLTRWRPQDLPPSQGRTRSQFDIIGEVGVEIVFLLWWTGQIHFRNLIPQHGLSLELAPVWRDWFWPILGYSAFGLVVNLLALMRPGRTRTVQALLLIRNLAGAAILSGVYQAGHWLEVSSAAWSPAAQAMASENFDRGMRIGIGWGIAVFLLLAGFNLWRLRSAADRAGPWSSTTAT